MISEEPSVFDNIDLYKMNKMILRNRIRAIDKPVHQDYLKTLISRWGSEQLLARLQHEQSGDLDATKVRTCLWEVSKFRHLKHLSKIFEYDIDGRPF